MIKLIGAMFIFISGVLIGFYQAAQYANRPKQIRLLIQALQRLETEINYGITPLPEALERIAAASSEPISPMFLAAAKRLSLNDGMTTSETWHDVMSQAWDHTAMKHGEKTVILQLGTTLGISDRSDQLKHLHLAVHQLHGEEAQAQDDRQKFEKMWKSLGALGGALAVILMY